VAREKGKEEIAKLIEDFPAKERNRLTLKVCETFGSPQHSLPVEVPSELCDYWMAKCSTQLTETEQNSIPSEYLTNDRKAKLSFLGEGAYGKVFEGKLDNPITHTELRLAVKVTSADLQMPGYDPHNPNVVSAADLEASVHKEIVVLSAFRHANIIKLLAYCWKSSTLSSGLPRMYLVYELAQGGSLEKQLLDDNLAGNLTWENRLAIARGVGSALRYMHSGDEGRAIAFHRDLKAANIVLSTGLNPSPKLIDCGLAKFIPTSDSVATVPTSSRCKVWGTPGYICPEYCSNSRGGYQSKNEVYSFGVLLAELFTGKLQNRCDTHHSSFRMGDVKVSQPDSRAGVLPENVHQAIRALTQRCLAESHLRPDLKQIDDMLALYQQKCRPVVHADITDLVQIIPPLVGVGLENHDAQRSLLT